MISQVGVTARNKSTNIALDFGLYSARMPTAHIEIFAVSIRAEYGLKGKQDCGFIFCRDPIVKVGWLRAAIVILNHFPIKGEIPRKSPPLKGDKGRC